MCLDRVVRCWDVEQGKETNSLNGNAKTATAVHFVQPNDPSLILCIFSFTAHLFDTRSNQIVSCIHSSGVVDSNRCGTSRGIKIYAFNLSIKCLQEFRQVNRVWRRFHSVLMANCSARDTGIPSACGILEVKGN